MRIKWLMFLTVVSLSFAIGVFANEEAEIEVYMSDLEAGIVTVEGYDASGSDGFSVSLLVLNPGYVIDEIETQQNALAHQWTTITLEQGYFKFQFKLRVDEDTSSGDFLVFVGGDSFNEPFQGSIYYATKQDKEDAISEINTLSANQVAAKFEYYITVLGIGAFVPAKTADAEKIAKRLKEITDKTPLPQGDFLKAQNVIKQISVLECYNQGKESVCFGSQGEFRHMDIIKFDSLDQTKDCTLYQIYNTVLNEEGKSIVRANLLNKDYKDLDQLSMAFLENVLIYSLTHAKTQGHGHVAQVLTEKNAATVGLDIPGYFALTSKASIQSALISGTYYTKKDIKDKIEAMLNTPIPTKTPTFGGGGGGGGSVSSVVLGNQPPTTQATPSPVPSEQPQPHETPQAVETKFTDIESVVWAKEAITNLSEKGVINGIEEKIFDPNSNVTREQFVKMICISMDLSIEEQEEVVLAFSDVEEQSWYYPYVTAAYKKGIVLGKQEDIFGIGDFITRQDVAAIISRALDMSGQLKEDFIDQQEISDYARQAVGYLSANGVINGYEDGSFLPKGLCTRAEAAVIIYRATLLKGGMASE